MIAERIHIASTRATRRSTIEPVVSALACAAPAARRSLLSLLLRAAAYGDRQPH